jgi:hypothetical protein
VLDKSLNTPIPVGTASGCLGKARLSMASISRLTVTARSGRADCSPTACANETAEDETLHGIVWIGASRQAEDQPDRDHAADNW